MDGTLVLVLLALVMLVGSYVAGSIPLNVSMSEDKLHKVTVLGAGLLVGTALAVIVPEGVRALFDVPGAPAAPSVPNVSAAAAALPATADPPHDLHSVIGISLVLGFVFMLLVEQLSARWGEGATATVGLVVHAAADGIALGAAATTAHADVELVVFLAIMLHKAPAAFGLVTFLLHAGLDRARIRRHLAVFACAAPALALLTYFGLGNEGKQTLSAFNATGIAMLFSAGTFLYVATVHVLPELTHGAGAHPHAHAHAHTGHSLLPGGTGGGGGERKRTGLQPAEVLLLAAGALLPPFLTLGHKH